MQLIHRLILDDQQLVGRCTKGIDVLTIPPEPEEIQVNVHDLRVGEGRPVHPVTVGRIHTQVAGVEHPILVVHHHHP